MDEEDATCYIIGDTIILPFDLNADDTLNVKNVPSNTDNSHLPNQQGDDKNESSLPKLNELASSSIPIKQAIDLNEFNLINQPHTGEGVNLEPQIRNPKVHELANQSSTSSVHQCSHIPSESSILDMSNQHTVLNKFDLEPPTITQKNHEDSPRPTAISMDSEENVIMLHTDTDKYDLSNCKRDNMTNNYSMPEDHTYEQHSFPPTDPTSRGNTQPCVSENSMGFAFNQDLIMSNNENNTQDSAVNCNDSFGMSVENRLIWPSNMDTRFPMNNFQNQFSPNNIGGNSTYFPASQSQGPCSAPYLQSINNAMLSDVNTDNANLTNTPWDDECRSVATEIYRDDATRFTVNSYDQECFAFASRDNACGQSTTECEPLGSLIPSERVHHAYPTLNIVDSKNHEHNRLLLKSLHNLIELPTAYPPLPFSQQYPIQGTYDARFPCAQQPVTDPLHIAEEDQISQQYTEQYQRDDQGAAQYNLSSNLMTNRPLDIMYDNQNSNSYNSRQPDNNVDQTCSYRLPQFNVSNVLTEVKDETTRGYFQPGEEILMEDATVTNRPDDTFIEKILETVHGEDLSTLRGQSPDVNDYRKSLEEIDDVKLQRVLSMERALRGEIHGNMALPPKWASKQITPAVQELDPKTKAEMKREEVANAAKAIFMKRTGTLFHWIHPGESKSELKARVEHAWSQLSEKESNYYFSQVLGRCNSDFQTRPMVNPRLMELLNPEDYRELAGTLNDESQDPLFLPETTNKVTKSPKQINFKQRRHLERQRPDQELDRSLKIPRGQETREDYSETDSNCEIIQENTENAFDQLSNATEQLSHQNAPYRLNPNEPTSFIANRESNLDRAVYMTDGSSCGNTLGSSSADFEFSKIVTVDKDLALTGINKPYAEKYKPSVRNRGPRGPYKKKGRRSKTTTDSDDDWEGHNTVARRGASMSGKGKPRFLHSVLGESDSEKSIETRWCTREFVDVDNCDDGTAQSREYSLSESLKGETTSNETRKTKSRGPRGPYKKRKLRTGGGRGKVRGRGRPSKRRKVSSEEDCSSEECLSLSEEDSVKRPQSTDFIKPIWNKRNLDVMSNDDSFDPCVSRQCESFSGKVKPSLQLQEELRKASLPEETNNDVSDDLEEGHYDGRQGDNPNCPYGSSFDQNMPERIRMGETKTKLKMPTKAKSRVKASEAFLVESEAMQMQFFQEVSSEDDNKAEAVQSLPLTSAAVAVNSLRRLHGSAKRAAQASSGSDTSDVDWSPRQLRCMSGKSSRRGSRTSRTRRRNSLPAAIRGAARKGALRF